MTHGLLAMKTRSLYNISFSANELVSKGVVAVVGPRTSTAVKCTQGIFKKLHIPQIAPSASDPTFVFSNYRFPFLLRMTPSASTQDITLADFVQTYKWERMGILTSRMDYGK